MYKSTSTLKYHFLLGYTPLLGQRHLPVNFLTPGGQLFSKEGVKYNGRPKGGHSGNRFHKALGGTI
jgi:hypothetical protein